MSILLAEGKLLRYMMKSLLTHRSCSPIEMNDAHMRFISMYAGIKDGMKSLQSLLKNRYLLLSVIPGPFI